MDDDAGCFITMIFLIVFGVIFLATIFNHSANTASDMQYYTKKAKCYTIQKPVSENDEKFFDLVREQGGCIFVK